MDELGYDLAHGPFDVVDAVGESCVGCGGDVLYVRDQLAHFTKSINNV